MNKKFAVIAFAAGMTFSGVAAFAQTVAHPSTSKATSPDMVAMCDSMMHDVMADPVLRKRMNALMRKHMSSMMGEDTTHGAAMRGGMMHGTSPAPTATP
ncbi:MAG: hypothetical protein NVSMB64_31770 [Candidatus Velthaea sp.]